MGSKLNKSHPKKTDAYTEVGSRKRREQVFETRMPERLQEVGGKATQEAKAEQ